MKTKVSLMYHDVVQLSNNESGFDTLGANYYKVSFRNFENQIGALAELISKGIIKQDDVVLTFDDGGKSFLYNIVPIIEKYGFIGHFYIATDYIGTPAFLDESELLELSNRGHIIGAHSSSHPENIQLLSEEEQMEEWLNSISKLESIIGKRITEVSIPNGYFLVSNIKCFTTLGIHTIYTSDLSDQYTVAGIDIIGRVAINHNTTHMDVVKILTNRYYRILIRLQLRLIKFAKYVLGNNYIKIKKKIRYVFR